MLDIQLPDALAEILNDMKDERITIGCTKDTVVRYSSGSKAYYLKTGVPNQEARREYDMLLWLKDKLPVPEVLYWQEVGDRFYLLTTSAKGVMSCTERGLASDEEQVIRALADGLAKLHNIDISSCHLMNRLDQRLDAALYNIENGLVDMEDFADNGRFDTPMELYHYLVKNKPDEDLCLTHGDYCLPNIFINGSKAAGFIDMGRGGVSDRYQDIALCVRSLRYNTYGHGNVDLLFECLGIKPDKDKIDYYIFLDELF